MPNHPFLAGDIVRIRDRERISDDCLYGFGEGMEHLCGCIARISSVSSYDSDSSDNPRRHGVALDFLTLPILGGIRWSYSTDMIEHTNERPPRGDQFNEQF
jgi:hypothetical protein